MLASLNTAVNYGYDFILSLPFVAMAMGKQQKNPFITRIVEAIIIAVFAGYISSQITLAVLENRMNTIEKQVDKIYNDIYRPSIPSP